MVYDATAQLSEITNQSEESGSKRIQPWDRYEWMENGKKCVKITFTTISSVTGSGKNSTTCLHPLGVENYNKLMELYEVIKKDFKILKWLQFSDLMSLPIDGNRHNRLYVLPGDLVTRPKSTRKDVFQVEKGFPSHSTPDQKLVLVTFIRRGKDCKILYAPLVTQKEKANRRINPSRLKVA